MHSIDKLFSFMFGSSTNKGLKLNITFWMVGSILFAFSCWTQNENVQTKIGYLATASYTLWFMTLKGKHQETLAKFIIFYLRTLFVLLSTFFSLEHWSYVISEQAKVFSVATFFFTFLLFCSVYYVIEVFALIYRTFILALDLIKKKFCNDTQKSSEIISVIQKATVGLMALGGFLAAINSFAKTFSDFFK